MSEATNKIVSSRGLMKSCDWYSNTPHSSIRMLLDYPPLPTNCSVLYVCSSAIPHFIRDYLKLIDTSFVLVSGDCDETIPYDIFKNELEFLEFVERPKLIHWFSQNLVVKHPKLTLMPIGMDYHTMTKSPMWGPITSHYIKNNY